MIKFIATLFGLGCSPFAPGTVGALFGMIVYLAVHQSAYLYTPALTLLILCGFWASGRAEKLFAEKDSRKIVIDEAAGMLLTFIGVKFAFSNLTVGFLLFRLFDILKPPPIRRLEKLPGSWGVMLDDVAAGIYANLALQILIRVSTRP